MGRDNVSSLTTQELFKKGKKLSSDLSFAAHSIC